MPAPLCPQCGSATRFAGYEPWCPACGWNREMAQDRLRRATRPIPFYYLLTVALFAAFFRVWKSPRPAVLFFVFGMPVIPFALLYVSLRWSRWRFERDLREAAGPRPAGAVRTAALPPNADFHVLREMPRPRPVRLSRKGRINLAIVMTAIFGLALIVAVRAYGRFAAAGSLAALLLADWIWLGLVVVIAWLPFATWKNVRRQKALMAYGEVTLARVVLRSGDQSSPAIRYEFEDAQGQKTPGMATDMAQSLYAGMSLIVFFDPQNPRRRVAQCEAFCEVELPGKG